MTRELTLFLDAVFKVVSYRTLARFFDVLDDVRRPVPPAAFLNALRSVDHAAADRVAAAAKEIGP